jgi:hypothetical protein
MSFRYFWDFRFCGGIMMNKHKNERRTKNIEENPIIT